MYTYSLQLFYLFLCPVTTCLGLILRNISMNFLSNSFFYPTVKEYIILKIGLDLDKLLQKSRSTFSETLYMQTPASWEADEQVDTVLKMFLRFPDKLLGIPVLIYFSPLHEKCFSARPSQPLIYPCYKELEFDKAIWCPVMHLFVIVKSTGVK